MMASVFSSMSSRSGSIDGSITGRCRTAIYSVKVCMVSYLLLHQVCMVFGKHAESCKFMHLYLRIYSRVRHPRISSLCAESNVGAALSGLGTAVFKTQPRHSPLKFSCPAAAEVVSGSGLYFICLVVR